MLPRVGYSLSWHSSCVSLCAKSRHWGWMPTVCWVEAGPPWHQGWVPTVRWVEIGLPRDTGDEHLLCAESRLCHPGIPGSGSQRVTCKCSSHELLLDWAPVTPGTSELHKTTLTLTPTHLLFSWHDHGFGQKNNQRLAWLCSLPEDVFLLSWNWRLCSATGHMCLKSTRESWKFFLPQTETV